MNVVFLGLGGNIGDRFENIRKTHELIEQDCGTIKKYSSVYETDAWGSNSQKKYLNQVIELHTGDDAETLLKKTTGIEEKLGRYRTKDQNSDRTVDIDILFFNDCIVNRQALHIPHPRLHLRKFVLIPLCELSGTLLHPILKKTVMELLESCKDKLNVTLVQGGQNSGS